MATQKSMNGKNTKAKMSTKSNTRKTAVKQTGKAAKSKKKVGKTVKKKSQRREIWVVGTFFAAFILMLAIFGVDGLLLDAIRSLIRGLFGAGSYIMPFAFLTACIIILFARGKPVAYKLFWVFSIPVLIGILEQALFCNIDFYSNYVGNLYKTGAELKSGGVISGGISMLLTAMLSEVGTIIITSVFLIYAILALCNIKLTNIFDFILNFKDEFEEKRLAQIDEEYDEYDDYEEYDEPIEEYIPPAPKITKKREIPSSEKQKKCKMTDIPLDAVPPMRKETFKKEIAMEVESSDDVDSGSESEYSSTDMVSEEIENRIEQSIDDINKYTQKIEHEKTDLPFEPDDDFKEAPLLDEENEEYIYEPQDISSAQVSLEPDSAAANVTVVDTHQVKEETTDEIKSVQSEAENEKEYIFPPISLLNEDQTNHSDDATEELRGRSQKLSDTLSSFGVEAQIINVIRGPSVTRYELLLARGVKLTRLTALQNDIALALGASSVRIAAIPDKSAVGIEVPNKVVQTVYLKDVLTSKAMADAKSKIAFAIGKDITGSCIVGDIGKMPHMLIAGTTGSGKSVCINSIIVSILYRATPDEVRFIMIDPKMVELGNYNGIPHLLIPVVTDYKKASGALNWAVVEMERRYKLMFECNVRDLAAYNNAMKKLGNPTLPQIVIIIDELADLMMVAAKEVEESICRIAQKARAAGMHLIIATQRPSADVLTGLMKSNIPSRIAFAVASQVESRIILDTGGADKLIGRGDMLYAPIGQEKPLRVQGCFLSGDEVESITDFIKQSSTADYSPEILEHIERKASDSEHGGDRDSDEDSDELLNDAIDVVLQTGQASSSVLQRKLKIGYARAARIIDQIEDRGIIGPLDSSKNRQILISKADWQEMKARRENY